ncbi:MAG: Ig-like domain-containing protein [Solitalea-like symbiont of Tyrophagus putrescentiae]
MITKAFSRHSTFILASFLIFTYSCANIQNPSGGPKDTVPPKLINANPQNQQIEFKGAKIILTFNKLVKIINPQKEIIVTPEMSIPPVFRDKKKSIIMDISRESLRPNTTYSINFGKSISDLTEGNLAEPYKYVFSTGSSIDSLSLSGKINYSIDSTEIKNVFVGIYDIKSANIVKDNPLWFTYTNDKGEFEFTNLSEGTYRLYTFTNNDQSRRFNYKKLLAFLSDDINLNKNITGLNLVLSKQIPDSIKIENKEFKSPKICLTLNYIVDPGDIEYKAIESESKREISLVLDTKGPSDTICFFPGTIKFSALEVTVGNKEVHYDKTVIRNFNPDAKPANVDINTNLSGSVLNDQNLKLFFSAPVQSIEKSKIILTENSSPVSNFELKPLNNNKALEFGFIYNWSKGLTYNITIPTQGVKSIYGGENLEFKREFTVENTEDKFGSLKLLLEVPEGQQYIVYLIDSAKKTESQKVIDKSSTIEFKNLLPGPYKLLFIHDLNKNSKWDAAKFTKLIQAEPLALDPVAINVRANWQFEQSYSLKPLAKGSLDQTTKK